MPAPQISWYDSTNTNVVSSWPIGQVDAGTSSAELRVLIWNNRSGSTQLSDMVNCTMTTKDTSGGNTTEPVTGKWVSIKVNSASESSFTAIGGTEGIEMGSVTGHEHAIKAAGAAAKTISGAINTGVATDTANFADVSMMATVPILATAGNTNFLVRVSYQYV